MGDVDGQTLVDHGRSCGVHSHVRCGTCADHQSIPLRRSGGGSPVEDWPHEAHTDPLRAGIQAPPPEECRRAALATLAAVMSTGPERSCAPLEMAQHPVATGVHSPTNRALVSEGHTTVSCARQSALRMHVPARIEGVTSTSEHSRLTVLMHRYELKYRSGDLRGLSTRGSVLCVAGKEVLVAAPHSVAHQRAGAEKAAEFYTGAIAEMCAEVNGWSAITAMRQYDDRSTDNPFELMIDAMIRSFNPRLIVEIHGMGRDWQTDVAIGSAARPSSADITTKLHEALACTFSTRIDYPFTGESSVGARATANRPDVQFIHLELGPRLRMDTTNETDLRSLVDGLRQIAAS